MKFSIPITLFLLSACSMAIAQEKIKTFEFKKGEVLDIILLSQIENSEKLFERYKETAFPVAFEYTYRPQPGFGISKLTLGTNKPSSFLFGKWSSIKKREDFLTNIVKRVPDFHHQRRVLFPYFGLTYYPMLEDLKFSIDTSNYNVVTAFWSDESNKEKDFFKIWKKAVETSGGKLVLILENGKSPLGYYYNADKLCIAEWQSVEAFQAFSEKHPLAFYEGLNNVHQFVIQ